MLAKIIECFCQCLLCRQSAELNGVQRSVLLNCEFDKSNLVFGGPVRGSAVFGPVDSERHFRPGRNEIGHARSVDRVPWRRSISGYIPLAQKIHKNEDAEALFCYKHVVQSVFAERRKASACPTITQHSVCCFLRYSPSPW